MRQHVLTSLCLLADLIKADIPAAPKRYSVPARRLNTGLERRAQDGVEATQHVVVDFDFGGQRIPLSLDSGSTYTWVASTLVEDPPKLPTLYNPDISTTFHVDQDPTNRKCANSDIDCITGNEDVSVGGLTAKGMVFGVARKVGDGVFNSGQAGTLGLGRQSGLPSKWLSRDVPFWYRAGANLEMPYLFAFDIYQDRNGTVDFGFLDTTKFTGEIVFVPVNTSMSNWNFEMEGYAIGNGSMQDATPFKGVVDSGGPNIGLPSEVVRPYFASFGGTPSSGNSHTFPCSAYPPPDLRLRLKGGHELVLNGTFLAQAKSRGTTCKGRLDDSKQTGYNIGASVLDQKYVVLDHQNLRIGFANKRHEGDPEGVLPASSTTTSPSPSVSASDAATAPSDTVSSTPPPGASATNKPDSRGVVMRPRSVHACICTVALLVFLI